MEILRKYGVGFTFYVPLILRTTGDQAASGDFTHAAGDTKISKDGGAAANIGTVPTAIAMGSGAMWKYTVSATEAQAALIAITTVDQTDPAIIEETMFIISTYGNASGQHAFDLDTAVQNVNVASSDNIGLTAQQKLDVNTEADTALAGYDAVTRTEATSDKAEIITDLDDIKGTSFVKNTHSLIDLKTETVLIVADTSELQVDDVPGLIAALNNLSTAQVNTQVDLALSDINLDHFVGTAAGIPALPAGTYLDLLQDDGTATYSRTTDSLQAIRDHAATIKSETALIVADTNELQVDDTPGAIAALNNVAITDIVSSGAITTLAGAVVNVDLVDVMTTYTGNTLQTGDVITAINDLANGTDGLTALKTAIDGLDDVTAAQVLTQVNTALDTAIAELSQGVPTATPTVRTALMLMYMALRNKLDVPTSGTDTLEIHNDAGTRIAQKLLTDSGGDYSEAKMISGA